MTETFDEFTPGMLESIGRAGTENQDVVKKLARFAIARHAAAESIIADRDMEIDMRDARIRELEERLGVASEATGCG
ncbi:MAG: hypothetical protein QOG85_1492 [Gaiellaceae bacterium]|nr:hypothetical protein [Gaiellaceae bacterium]